MTVLGFPLVGYSVGEYEDFDGICENCNSSDLFLISGKDEYCITSIKMRKTFH